MTGAPKCDVPLQTGSAAAQQREGSGRSTAVVREDFLEKLGCKSFSVILKKAEAEIQQVQ